MHLEVLCDVFDKNYFATTKCAFENVWIMWVFRNGIKYLSFIVEFHHGNVWMKYIFKWFWNRLYLMKLLNVRMCLVI
jgi:hypothetical protein